MTSPSAIIHCNAGGEHGMGHLMRALAVAEEAIQRSWRVRFAGALAAPSVALLSHALPTAEVTAFPGIMSPTEWQDVLAAEAPDVLHLDTYVGKANSWQHGDWLLSNVQDGEFGRRTADISIDPNLDAELASGNSTTSSQLLGIDYALIREQVRSRRAKPQTHIRHAKILVVMGGTDPTEITPQVLSLLNHLPGQRSITVITPPHLNSAVSEAARTSQHVVTPVPFAKDLPGMIASHDLVLSAAGTSVWDIACIGVPMALVCVVDNQEKGYEAAVQHGLAFPLGNPSARGLEEGILELGKLISGRPQELQSMALRAFNLVDGKGPSRVLDAWERRLKTSS